MSAVSESTAQLLSEKIDSKTAQVGIVGLGYVGLPLISAFTNAGFRCIGYDVDQHKIDALLAGRSYIKHIESSTIADWIQRDVLDPTSDMSRLAEADVVLICVPTPLTASQDPDLRYVELTAEAIAKVLRPGQMVVLESTTYPTTTRDVMVPILEQNPAGLLWRRILCGVQPGTGRPGQPRLYRGRHSKSCRWL